VAVLARVCGPGPRGAGPLARQAGRAEPALWHARRCLAICEANGIAGWDIAAGYEALARAHLVAGDLDAVAIWKAKGYEALAPVADLEDREVIESDLATLP
jgi:hypothetical protein